MTVSLIGTNKSEKLFHPTPYVEKLANKLRNNGFNPELVGSIYQLLRSLNSSSLHPTEKWILSHKEVIAYRNKSGESLIDKTLRKMKLVHLQILISCNHPLEKINTSDDSALLVAVKSGSLSKVKAIWDRISSDLMKAKNHSAEFPLKLAIQKKYTDITDFFLAETSRLEDLVPDGALSKFIKFLFGSKLSNEFLGKLLSRCRLSSVYDQWGKTPLFWARYYWKFDFCGYLHARGLHQYFSIQNMKLITLGRSVCLLAPRIKYTIVVDKTLHEHGGEFTHIYPVIRYLWWRFSDKIRKALQQKTIEPFYSQINRALLLASTEASARQVYNTYCKSRPIIIPTGWNEHSVAIAFYKDILIIGNRGDKGAEQTHRLQIHRIKQAALSISLIKIIQNCREDDKKISEKFLYKDLLQTLEANEDNFCLSVQKQLNIDTQIGPSCTSTSLFTALFGLLISKHQDKEILDPDTYKAVHTVNRHFKAFARFEIQEAYRKKLNDNAD